MVEPLFWAVVIVLAVLTAGLLLFFARSLIFMFSIFQGPVYVPSTDEDMETMLQLAHLKKGMKVIDLGSGDGKIVIAAAQQGAQALGVEINPLLVRSSRKNILAAGVKGRAQILKQSFWKTDLSQYDVVFLYGTTYIMEKLEHKLQQEMRPGSVFISNYFQLPSLRPAQTVRGKIRKYLF